MLVTFFLTEITVNFKNVLRVYHFADVVKGLLEYTLGEELMLFGVLRNKTSSLSHSLYLNNLLLSQLHFNIIGPEIIII